MKRNRLVLWALDTKLKLSDVQRKLENDYTQELTDLLQLSIPRDERVLKHRWNVYIDSLRESSITKERIKYLFAKGIIEVDKLPKEFQFERNGQLIPKKHRVREAPVETLFFEMYGRVYAVLAVPKNLESKVRSRLFHKDHEWGKIDYKELPQYKLDTDFFNWLMLKKGQEIVDSNGNTLQLLDVAGFSSEVNRGASQFTGSGGNITNQPATKTMISMSTPFNELILTIKYKEMNLHFNLASLSECNVDDEKTYKTEKENPMKFIFLNIHEAIITIYYEIIPLLKSAFHMEVNNGEFRPNYDIFQKDSGLRVIEDIVTRLGLTINDISTLSCFKKSV